MRYNRICGVAVLLFALCTTVQAQTAEDYKARSAQWLSKQREEMQQFKENRMNEIKNFRDSINAEYARFLEEKWEEFNTTRRDMGFKPMPKAPVYVPTPDVTPQPLPQGDEKKAEPVVPDEKPSPFVPTPVPEPPAPAPVTPAPTPVAPTPTPAPSKSVRLEGSFFGQPIQVEKITWKVPLLTDVAEGSVASQWKALSALKLQTILDDVSRLQSQLNLDDWGTYQLACALGPIYNPAMRANDRVVFSIFLMNQLG